MRGHYHLTTFLKNLSEQCNYIKMSDQASSFTNVKTITVGFLQVVGQSYVVFFFTWKSTIQICTVMMYSFKKNVTCLFFSHIKQKLCLKQHLSICWSSPWTSALNSSQIHWIRISNVNSARQDKSSLLCWC